MIYNKLIKMKMNNISRTYSVASKIPGTVGPPDGTSSCVLDGTRLISSDRTVRLMVRGMCG